MSDDHDEIDQADEQDFKEQIRQRAIDLQVLEWGIEVDWSSRVRISLAFQEQVETWLRKHEGEDVGFYNLESDFPGDYAEGKWDRRGPLISVLESFILRGTRVEQIRRLCELGASPSEVRSLVDRTLRDYTARARRSFNTSD